MAFFSPITIEHDYHKGMMIYSQKWVHARQLTGATSECIISGQNGLLEGIMNIIPTQVKQRKLTESQNTSSTETSAARESAAPLDFSNSALAFSRSCNSTNQLIIYFCSQRNEPGVIL